MPLFNQVKESSTPKLPRQIGELLIDRSYSWGLPDGACQEEDLSRLGRLLFLSDEYFYTFKENVGRGSNKLAKLLAELLASSKKTNECGLRAIQVYRDSLLVKWMKSEHLILNVYLQAVAQHLREVVYVFENFPICHIYREINQKANALSSQFAYWESPCSGIF